MGTKVQVDNQLPGYCLMRDLNHDPDSTSWASFYGESNLSNGQYYCSPLLKVASDSLPGGNKDSMKQTILKHEAIFKNQVLELHRVYRVQKDLMDEFMRKEQYKHRSEASSSSSVLPSQMTPDDSNLKGKSIQASSSPLQKRGSLKESEVSESRPTKVRKMIDLELLPDEYIDVDEVEQQENRAARDSEEKLLSRSESCSRKPNPLADLNEPLQSEETSANPSVNFLGVPSQDNSMAIPSLSKDFPWNSKHGNLSCNIDNYQNNSKENGHHWLSSVLKADGNKESGRSLHQPNHHGKASMSSSPVKRSHELAGVFAPNLTAKANAGFTISDRMRSFSSYGNGDLVLPSQMPSYAASSTLPNSWDPSWARPNTCLSQKSSPAQVPPYINSGSLSKSPQSSVWSNEYHGNGWHANGHPIRNAGFAGESLVQNDKANSFDLNVASSELLAEPSVKIMGSEVKRVDPLAVLPWLRQRVDTCNDKVARTLNHQNSVVSSSCDVNATTKGHQMILGVPILQEPFSKEEEIEGVRRSGLLDINMPCDESEDFDNSTTMSEVVLREEKTETRRSSGLPNMFDLNSCIVEEEIPSASDNSMKIADRAPIIDLEGPIDLEAELPLESPVQDSTDSVDQERARVAADAIIAISSYRSDPVQEVSVPEDPLAWFVNVVCSCPDDTKSSPGDTIDSSSIESDYFEEMTLKLTECTPEEYFPSPPVFDFPNMEETGPANITGRSRRGPARRGRPRKDFQRDILPGLVSLSRNEITEDIQIFGELMRATGHEWNCGNRRNGSRNGSRRGRKRKSVVTPAPPPPPPAAPVTPPTVKQAVNNGEIILESWGKTTRRPRRQRCPPATGNNVATIALA